MKAVIILTTLIFTVLSCSINPKENSKDETVSKAALTEEKIFRQLLDFPKINDTAKFIVDLRQIFELEVHDSPVSREIEKISFYGKVNLYGSDKDFYLVEYDYGEGSTASFPWKYQLLFTKEGKLVQVLSALRLGLIKIFPGQNPFLIAVTATGKGNGGHEVYKISADTLENVYEGYYDYAIQTYDAHQDNAVFEPAELNIFINDDNADGFNDIVFKGKIILIQGRTKNGSWYDNETKNGKTISYSISNPFKIAPIEFVFLYDIAKGHFKAKEDYEKKYKDFHY